MTVLQRFAILLVRKAKDKQKSTAATGFSGVLWLVNRHRADGLVAAAQVTEGHSGVEHVKEWNLCIV